MPLCSSRVMTQRLEAWLFALSLVSVNSNYTGTYDTTTHGPCSEYSDTGATPITALEECRRAAHGLPDFVEPVTQISRPVQFQSVVYPTYEGGQPVGCYFDKGQYKEDTNGVAVMKWYFNPSPSSGQITGVTWPEWLAGICRTSATAFQPSRHNWLQTSNGRVYSPRFVLPCAPMDYIKSERVCIDSARLFVSGAQLAVSRATYQPNEMIGCSSDVANPSLIYFNPPPVQPLGHVWPANYGRGAICSNHRYRSYCDVRAAGVLNVSHTRGVTESQTGNEPTDELKSALGTCWTTETRGLLEHGATCKPECKSGYYLKSNVTCDTGNLVPHVCASLSAAPSAASSTASSTPSPIPLPVSSDGGTSVSISLMSIFLLICVVLTISFTLYYFLRNELPCVSSYMKV